MIQGVGSISQIVNRNSKDYANGIRQLFALLPKVSNSSKHIVQQAILFLMESNHQWANILTYAQKWKLESFMREIIPRMRMRVKEPESPLPESDGLLNQLRRLIQKCWMLVSPKKIQNVYNQLPAPSDIIKISNTYQAEKYTTAQLKSSLQGQGAQNQPKKLEIQLGEASVANQANSKQRSDPLSNVTGRPTILKKTSILTNSLQPKVDKIQINNQRNQTKNILNNIPKSDNVIKLLLNYNNSKLNQQQQHRQKQKLDTIASLLIPKAPTKNVDEQCPPQRFNFGSNRKSQAYKTIAVSPKKFDPDQFILKIKVKQPTAPAKQEPVSQIKSLYDFSFTKQKPKSPKQALNAADTNFDSFYQLQKLPESQSQPLIVQAIPSVQEPVNSDPAPVISNQSTPVFNLPIKIPQPRKYAESLTEEDLKMLGSDIKVTNIFKKICQGMGLVVNKYFDQAMKVDF